VKEGGRTRDIDVGQESDEGRVVVMSDAVCCPRTVVVHSEDASVASLAVMSWMGRKREEDKKEE